MMEYGLLHKYSDLLENCHTEEERESYKYLCAYILFFFFSLRTNISAGIYSD